MANQFFSNQFAHIYDLFYDSIAPRIQAARNQQAPNLHALKDEAEDSAVYFADHMNRGDRQVFMGQNVLFPEFLEAYDTIRDLNTQVNTAEAQGIPEAQAMRQELRQKKDELQDFLNEEFLRKFLHVGIPLQRGGRKRKVRKSRKAKRKARKTRRR